MNTPTSYQFHCQACQKLTPKAGYCTQCGNELETYLSELEEKFPSFPQPEDFNLDPNTLEKIQPSQV